MQQKHIILALVMMSLSQAGLAEKTYPVDFKSEATTPTFHRWYASLEAGESMSTSLFFRPSNYTSESFYLIPDNGWPVNDTMGRSFLTGAVIGYNFSHNMSLDLSYDQRTHFRYDEFGSYRSMNVLMPLTLFPPFIGGTEFFLPDIKIRTFILGLNLSPNVNLGGFTPYIAVGLGIASNKVGTFENIDIDSPPQFDFIVPGHTQTNFAWKIGAGANYAVNNQFHLNVGYRLMDVGSIKTSQSAYDTVLITNYTDAAFQANHVLLNEVFLGLAYDFA